MFSNRRFQNEISFDSKREVFYYLLHHYTQYNSSVLCINWNLFFSTVLKLKPGLLCKLTSDLYCYLYDFYPFVFEEVYFNKYITQNKQKKKIVKLIYSLNKTELINISLYLIHLSCSTIPTAELTSCVILWLYEDYLSLFSNMLFEENISLEKIELEYQNYILLNTEYPFLNKCTLHKIEKQYNSNSILPSSYSDNFNQNGWQWRYNMAQKLANAIKRPYFGIHCIYLIGSTNTMSATEGSDIDILIHITKDKPHFSELAEWFIKWNQILSTINIINTGLDATYLLDIHYITDEDIINKTSYVSLITSIENPITTL